MKTTISSYQFFNCLLRNRYFSIAMGSAKQNTVAFNPNEKKMIVVVGRY